MRVLIPLPAHGFEATETSAPWRVLTDAGHSIVFATPDGEVARPDEATLSGAGLGWLGRLARAEAPAVSAYRAMEHSQEFNAPLAWAAVDAGDIDAIVIPGGHHPDMCPFFESAALQSLIAKLFAQDKLVAAICHGVLLVARSTGPEGRPVLAGHRTTVVPGLVENVFWQLAHRRMGQKRYGKPYEITAEEEVRSLLSGVGEVVMTKPPVLRDAPGKEHRGMCIVDGNYISARLPHDAWCFSKCVAEELARRQRS